MRTRIARDERLSRRRSRIAGLVGAIGAAVTLTSAAAGPLAPSAAREGELIHLIRQDCGSCHGMTLKGGLGAPLLPETLAGKDTDVLATIILDGMHGTPMPPWRSLLTEAEAVWIAHKLKEGLP